MSLNHTISRRTVFKGTGAVAAASALGAGAALGVASPAHAAGLEVTNQETDGSQCQELKTSLTNKVKPHHSQAKTPHPTLK